MNPSPDLSQFVDSVPLSEGRHSSPEGLDKIRVFLLAFLLFPSTSPPLPPQPSPSHHQRDLQSLIRITAHWGKQSHFPGGVGFWFQETPGHTVVLQVKRDLMDSRWLMEFWLKSGSEWAQQLPELTCGYVPSPRIYNWDR